MPPIASAVLTWIGWFCCSAMASRRVSVRLLASLPSVSLMTISVIWSMVYLLRSISVIV